MMGLDTSKVKGRGRGNTMLFGLSEKTGKRSGFEVLSAERRETCKRSPLGERPRQLAF